MKALPVCAASELGWWSRLRWMGHQVLKPGKRNKKYRLA